MITNECTKKSVGRPTKYTPEVCDEIIKYFDIEPHFETPIITTNKQGIKTEKIAFIPSDLPTLAGFAVKIGVDRDTIKEWAKVYPEFSAAIKRAKECQEHILITNAMNNGYSQPFAIFFAKNNLRSWDEPNKKWSDRTETDLTTGGEKLEPLIIIKDGSK